MTTNPTPFGLTDAQLDALHAEPMLAYHLDIVEALLDEIAELQGPEREEAIRLGIAAMPVWTLPAALLAKTEEDR